MLIVPERIWLFVLLEMWSQGGAKFPSVLCRFKVIGLRLEPSKEIVFMNLAQVLVSLIILLIQSHIMQYYSLTIDCLYKLLAYIL